VAERVLELVAKAAPYLAQHGSASPRLDAELLLAEALGCGRMDLYLQFERTVLAMELERFRELCRRRAGGEPIAYIRGRREFMSLDIRVTPQVLVPRPETELLVEEGLRRMRDNPAPRFLDIGTGSGAIAVALLAHSPLATGVATDISGAALEVAGTNAQALGVATRLQLLQADLDDGVDGRFDLVTANLPYVDPDWPDAVTEEVRRSEPAVALFAGAGGLDQIGRLIPRLAGRLLPGGAALLECDPRNAEQVRDLASGHGATTLAADLAGHQRMLVFEPPAR
jgi:release factor glutamine methyltransferase